MSLSLKQILDGYAANLCGRCYQYQISGKQTVRVIFYREHLCHLIGIDHVYPDDRRYLGASGYAKIASEEITVAKLREHNEKQFNFIKLRLAHFGEIPNLMDHCDFFKFYQDRCEPRTRIMADFLVHKNCTEYRLHLFLRQERSGGDLYSPVSFVVKSEKDPSFNQFILRQEQKKVTGFICRSTE